MGLFKQDHWNAAALKVFACFCYALVNGIVRYLVGGSSLENLQFLPFYEIAFLQNFFAVLFLLPFFWGKGLVNFKVRFPILLMVQIIFSVLGVLAWYAALQYMSLVYAVALAFTGPIFSVIACKFILKEALTPFKLAAIFISFAGAFLITRPDLAFLEGTGIIAELGWAVLLPLLSATAWVAVKVCSRILALHGESSKVMSFYLFLFMTPVFLLFSIPGWVTPNLEHLIWTAGLGALGAIAYLAIVESFRRANVSFLMPFGFVRLVFSAMLGYLAFNELPQRSHEWMGAAVIMMSLLFLSADLRRNKQVAIA